MMDRQIDSPIPTPPDFVSGLVGWLNLHGIVLSDPLAAPPTALYASLRATSGTGGDFSR
jgi:hypothetical protein